MVDRNHRLIHDYFLEGAHAMYCDQKVHATHHKAVATEAQAMLYVSWLLHGHLHLEH